LVEELSKDRLFFLKRCAIGARSFHHHRRELNGEAHQRDNDPRRVVCHQIDDCVLRREADPPEPKVDSTGRHVPQNKCPTLVRQPLEIMLWRSD
jgi:hypothetical protein